MKATSSMYSRVLGGAVAVGLLTLVAYKVVQSQGYEPGQFSTGRLEEELLAEDRAFDFSADPELELLRYETYGGTAIRWTRTKLFADGRLLVELIWPSTGEVVEAFEWELSYEEVMSLLDPLVHSGFMESSENQIFDQLQYLHESPNLSRPSSHSTVTKLTLNLEQYRGPNQTEMAPATNSIKLNTPSRLSDNYPGVPSLDALTALSEHMKHYVRIAMRGGK